MTRKDALKLARVRELAASGDAEMIRARSHFSRSEIARLVGVSHVTLRRWERGERRPCGMPALRYLELLEGLDRQQAEVSAR